MKTWSGWQPAFCAVVQLSCPVSAWFERARKKSSRKPFEMSSGGLTSV
jgi:hypothetical protein